MFKVYFNPRGFSGMIIANIRITSGSSGLFLNSAVCYSPATNRVRPPVNQRGRSGTAR